jgi:hypothetical protein
MNFLVVTPDLATDAVAGLLFNAEYEAAHHSVVSSYPHTEVHRLRSSPMEQPGTDPI